MSSKTAPSLFSNVFVLGISMVIFMGSGYLVQIGLAHILPPAEYGLFGILISTLNIGELLFSNGIFRQLAAIIGKDVSKTRPIIRTARRLQGISASIASIGILLLADPLAQSLQAPELRNYFWGLAFLFPIYGLRSLYASAVSGLELFRKQSVHRSIGGALKLLSIPLVLFTGTLYGVLLAYFLSSLYLFIAYRRVATLSPHFHEGEGIFPMKRLLQSTLPTLAFVSFPPVFQAIDIYFVRLLLPDRPELTGVYVALASIAKIPYFLFFPFTTALVPRFAQYFHTQNLVQIQKTQRSVDGILLLVLLPTVVLGSVFSTDLLLLFYPDSYATGAMAFCFLLAGTAFVALSENALLPYFAYGRYNVVLQHVLASLALAFVLLLVLVPKYELIGASASILISSLLLFLLTRLRSRQTFQLSFPFARLPALLGAATLSGSLAFFLPKGIEWLLPSAAISLAAYILCLVLFRGFSNEEREKLSSLVTTLTERIRR